VAGIGIGPALRRARLLRGKSIEEASRETRIRAEYLQALERETFEAILGDVYVRGFLRSYSAYLGLDPSSILTLYRREFGVAKPRLPEPVTGPPGAPTRQHPHLLHIPRPHLSWRFLLAVTALALAMLAAAGLLSRSRSAPPAAGAPSGGASIPVLSNGVTVGVLANAPVTLTVIVDGGSPVQYQLHPGEGRSFPGTTSVRIELSRGGVTVVTVNGHSIGTPGSKTAPFAATYSPKDYRRSSSVASPSP